MMKKRNRTKEGRENTHVKKRKSKKQSINGTRRAKSTHTEKNTTLLSRTRQKPAGGK